MFPMVDSSSPASLKDGLTVADTAYYKDGVGSWTSLSITDTVTEIASTGMYTIEFTQAELNHDLIMLKVTSAGAADSVIIIRTFAVDVEDLVRSLTPANALDVDSNNRIDVGSWNGISATNSSTTNKPQVDLFSVSDDAPAANNLELDYDGTGLTRANSTIGTATAVTDDVDITQSGADKVWGTTVRTLSAAGVQAIWDALTSALTTANSIGKKLADWVLGSDDKVEVSADAHSSGQTIKDIDTTGLDNINAEVDTALDTAIPASPTSLSINDYAKRTERYAHNVDTIIKHDNGVQWAASQKFYLDLTNGNDSNDGLTKATARLTFASALGLCTAYNNDSITLVNSTGSAYIWDTVIDINVATTHVVGPGPSFLIKPTSSGTATVILSADEAHIEGVRIETHASTGNDNAVEVTANRCQVHNVFVTQSRGSGIVITDSNLCTIKRFRCESPGSGGNGHGIHITGNCAENFVHSGVIFNAAGDGIRMTGAGCTTNTIWGGFDGLIIHESGAYGINETGGADKNHIAGPGIVLGHNTTADTNLSGDTLKINVEQWLKDSDKPTNFEDMAITDATGLVSVGTNNDKTGYDLNADQSGVTIGTVNALGAQAKADVNAEVVDVMTVDTIAELAQGLPPITPTIIQALMLAYMKLRDKVEQTSNLLEIHNDAGTVITKAIVSDDGTTFTKGKLQAGP